MTNFVVCLSGLRFLQRPFFIQSTLYDTIIDTDVDFLSEFMVMDTYNQSTIYRLSRKLARLWLGVMPSSINQKWGVPVFLACLAYECLKPVGHENVILFAPFPRRFFVACFCGEAVYGTISQETHRRQVFTASIMRFSVSAFYGKHEIN